MRHQGPFGDEPTESRRPTPSVGLRDASPTAGETESANEDFLFHLYRGSELLQDNRVHEAKEELERALHLQPRDTKGQDLLAVVYFRLGLYPRAIQIYEQLRRRNPNDTSLLLNLSLCYLKVGQPQLARHDLEHLLSINPSHTRAWGYLGIACERLGDLSLAERAFQRGGHQQMAQRMATRRGTSPSPGSMASPAQEVRAVADAAYRELDTGELQFTLAQSSSDALDETPGGKAAAQSWLSIEHGKSDEPPPLSQRPGDSSKPDTGDGTKEPQPLSGEMVPSIPQLGVPQSLNRRPTLIAPVGAPPAGEQLAPELAQVDRIPSHSPAPFVEETVIQAVKRRPVVAVPSPYGPANVALGYAGDGGSGTLQPTPFNPSASDRPDQKAKSSTPGPDTPLGIGGPQPLLPPSAQVPASALPRSEPLLAFPLAAGASLHPSGVALVRTTAALGFSARLESIRVQQSGLDLRVLDRQKGGQATGEAFGGITSPMTHAAGEGMLILGARPGRRIFAFHVDAQAMCFAREDAVLGFGGGLTFENGRMTTGEGEHVAVVQLRGEGTVLLEVIGDVLTLGVQGDRSLTVRREVVLGWVGRFVPRALAPNEAPCGQRGLVSFAGDGRVLVLTG